MCAIVQLHSCKFQSQFFYVSYYDITMMIFSSQHTYTLHQLQQYRQHSEIVQLIYEIILHHSHRLLILLCRCHHPQHHQLVLSQPRALFYI